MGAVEIPEAANLLLLLGAGLITHAMVQCTLYL
jgi:hypothetical protein